MRHSMNKIIHRIKLEIKIWAKHYVMRSGHHIASLNIENPLADRQIFEYFLLFSKFMLFECWQSSSIERFDSSFFAPLFRIFSRVPKPSLTSSFPIRIRLVEFGRLLRGVSCEDHDNIQQPLSPWRWSPLTTTGRSIHAAVAAAGFLFHSSDV